MEKLREGDSTLQCKTIQSGGPDREAIDDVRYATKMRQLAFEAIATGDVDKRYAGKTALQWFALLDEKSVDLSTMRLEMIRHIVTLHDALEGKTN